MVLKFGVSNSTIVLQIPLSKLIHNYPEIRNSSLFLHYFKKYLKTITEICKKNATEFKLIIKICLKTLAFLFHDFALFEILTKKFLIS